MMTIGMKRALCRSVALALGLSASSAWACSTAITRGQATVWSNFSKEPGQLPQEVAILEGDLMSVLMPRNARASIVDASGKTTETLVALAAERYAELSEQGRGAVPIDVRLPDLPRTLAWQHYGAALPGTAYLKLVAGKEHALVRVQIDKRPVAPRGEQQIWNDARQQETISLTQFDTLALDLPGEPGDGWQVEMRAGRALLKTVALKQDASPTRVLLHLDAQPGASEDVLIVRRKGREVYRFLVQPRPMPAC